MRRISPIIFLVLMEIVFLGMSYFGKLNPHPSGLLSSFYVLCFVLFSCGFAGYWGRAAFRVVVSLAWFIQFVLTVSNWWYFQYFQSYFNYEALQLGADSIASFRAISVFDNKANAVTLTLLSMFFLVCAVRSSSIERVKPRTSILLCCFGLIGAAISGSILSISFDRYRELNIFSLAPSYISPVHAFFVSTSIASESPKTAIGYEEFTEMNRGLAIDRKLKDYNVIVIVLESMRASLIGHYNGGRTVTPNFDKFARENTVATTFYANSNYTVKGETAIFCGIFDHNSKPPISKYADEIKNLTCLPHILEKKGYKSIYFHGNRAEFYSRDKYMKAVGFEELQFFDQARRKSLDMSEIGWGVADEAMYDYMMTKLLNEAERPFFASVTTLSSHYPFDWEWNIEFPNLGVDAQENAMYSNYNKAVYYEDYAFGKFWDAFRQSKLYKNTIVVVTADHGIWSFSDNKALSLVEQNEQFFRMPLMIYSPNLTSPRHINQVSSQIDIPPTVLSLLGINEEESAFIGKDIFVDVEKPWSISMKSGELSVRVNDTICSTSTGECGGVHQECTARNYGEILLHEVSDIQRCIRVERDLLKGGDYSNVEDGRELVGKGLSIIRRHNKHVFGEGE
ncbi:Lipoteichoic acid synthase 2 [Zhongshania aliphaticivorans]|uniref:Lipoteichoic acid synthase 2 n=1 Tax=Zhongshania aliphaticivorans TaxID=1470434 RepID=A0A5S9N070_9GAMM|nr:LTA synthase family protein [Zhongshania aliphaticivorans]CAA0082967.1 Lipoteichoic acid synthase 2 [Zhongshania aliphaticivorans]CAA0083788.1 Lipoteichoic acid synthase 2 [Zhongshania aliphaticivorans]